MLWLLIPLLAGVAVAGYFWDDIRDWFSSQMESWEGEGWLKTNVKKTFIQIDRLMVGGRRIVKRAIAYFQKQQKLYKKTTEEEVSADDLPEDVRHSISRGKTVELELSMEQ